MNANGVARQALGRYGEELAARRLAEAGMTVIARNWRCRSGEIDIVARDGDALVVCEVKTRRAGEFVSTGWPGNRRGAAAARTGAGFAEAASAGGPSG
ncbi:YraN family protein, partial [Streptomyces sp. NPDC001193]